MGLSDLFANFTPRVPFTKEPIDETEEVEEYDKGARIYIWPLYKHFVWKVMKRGIRRGWALDIGTGTGLLPLELAKVKNSDLQVVGLDISDTMIHQARRNVERAKAEDRVHFIVASAAYLPFKDASLDIVASNASLHRWNEPVQGINEIERVTKPEGAIIMRDSRRLPPNLFWRAFQFLVTSFMNESHKEAWPQAVAAAYTIPEVNEILAKTRLRPWKVFIDLMFIDLCIESR
ncbi:MAG: class I SAM-dependent methyltransferase [Chloroflexi bacterium]|nr:class I SAM-dependent methyltransferase [Chloroflexota bacterium]